MKFDKFNEKFSEFKAGLTEIDNKLKPIVKELKAYAKKAKSLKNIVQNNEDVMENLPYSVLFAVSDFGNYIGDAINDMNQLISDLKKADPKAETKKDVLKKFLAKNK